MNYLLWILNLCLLGLSSSVETDIRCMNFYGLETTRANFVCDWQHNPSWYLEKLKYDMHINTLRIPFSYDYVYRNDWVALDQFVANAQRLNMRIIFDYHRTYATHQGPIPEEGISRDQFVACWLIILSRYQHYDNVFGVGIFNEIQYNNDFQYANDLHQHVIERIEDEFPGRFSYFAGCPNWGGNCSGMELSHMPTWDRTYIEVHKYIFSGNSNPSDWDKSIPPSIAPEHWFVGEFGWKHDVPIEREWAETFISYLYERNITNACAWTIAHSGDTEGWWKDDCETFNWGKAGLLTSLWSGSLKRIRTYLRERLIGT